jgi:hypothetical protein
MVVVVIGLIIYVFYIFHLLQKGCKGLAEKFGFADVGSKLPN